MIQIVFIIFALHNREVDFRSFLQQPADNVPVDGAQTVKTTLYRIVCCTAVPTLGGSAVGVTVGAGVGFGVGVNVGSGSAFPADAASPAESLSVPAWLAVGAFVELGTLITPG
ncbi:MAG: hypothetical protein ACLS6G_08460 [Christensenellales bacterium]